MINLAKTGLLEKRISELTKEVTLKREKKKKLDALVKDNES